MWLNRFAMPTLVTNLVQLSDNVVEARMAVWHCSACAAKEDTVYPAIGGRDQAQDFSLKIGDLTVSMDGERLRSKKPLHQTKPQITYRHLAGQLALSATAHPTRRG